MRGTRALLMPVLALTMLSGCSGERTTSPGPDIRLARQIPEEFRSGAAQLVEGNNAFALDLYGELKSNEGNLFFSPYSISTAMAMIWAGTRGQTEAEIAEVLHFPYGQEGLHPVFGTLQQSLDTGVGFELYQLNIANRLWGLTGYPWLEPFLAITRESYGAELQELDFMGAPEASRATINEWIGERTAGKILELLKPGTVPFDTRLVLTNAIYFKGDWASQFAPDRTKPGDFMITGDETVEVPMMRQSGRFPFKTDTDLLILEMPYVGQDLGMALLPARVDGLAELEANLTPANLSSWLELNHEREVSVALPRFTFSSAFRLNDTMGNLGMPSAFDMFRADFSGMTTGEDLYLTSLVHEAFVLVNEEGTEAAAATGGVVGPTSAPPSFTADHPFAFLILDRVTGSILFLGRVVDPRG